MVPGITYNHTNIFPHTCKHAHTRALTHTQTQKGGLVTYIQRKRRDRNRGNEGEMGEKHKISIHSTIPFKKYNFSLSFSIWPLANYQTYL